MGVFSLFMTVIFLPDIVKRIRGYVKLAQAQIKIQVDLHMQMRIHHVSPIKVG